MKYKFDLGERLIQFAVAVKDVSESLPKTFARRHLAGQLVRCGTSPALNYGEAQSAESRNDFIHKMKVSLKELRETYTCLPFIRYKKWGDLGKLVAALNENNQLIAIFVKSIATAQKNTNPKHQPTI